MDGVPIRQIGECHPTALLARASHRIEEYGDNDQKADDLGDENGRAPGNPAIIIICAVRKGEGKSGEEDARGDIQHCDVPHEEHLHEERRVVAIWLEPVDEKETHRADHTKPDLGDRAPSDMDDHTGEQKFAHALVYLKELVLALVRASEKPHALTNRRGLAGTTIGSNRPAEEDRNADDIDERGNNREEAVGSPLALAVQKRSVFAHIGGAPLGLEPARAVPGCVVHADVRSVND